MGVMLWFAGDVEKVFAELAPDDSDCTAWFRAQMLAVTGIELEAETSPRR